MSHRKEFNALFWDWAAYDLNWISIAGEERWLNGKGGYLECNEENLDRLRSGLEVLLRIKQPALADKLSETLDIIDKYQGRHVISDEQAKEDLTAVLRSISYIMRELPELKTRRVTLMDWVNNGNDRKYSIYSDAEPPPPVLIPPTTPPPSPDLL